jgi:hypothetical protein
MTNTLFFLLGALDEYDGRAIIENGDVVERFYASEKEAAMTFEFYLRKFARECELECDVAVETDTSGAMVFRSRDLTALIDQCYTFDLDESGYVTSAGEPRVTIARMSMAAFTERDWSAKRSFLAGAYARFGRKGEFRLANAEHKALLIRDLLRELGCSNVELMRANPGYVPAIRVVRFTPTPAIDSWLRSAGTM